MHRLKALMFVGVVSAGVLWPRVTPAMTFEMFDVMAVEDQRDYVKFLVNASQKILIEQGKPDLATRVEELFDGGHPKDPRASGDAQFRANLIGGKRYLADHPDLPFRLTVESTFTETLIRNLGLGSLPFKFHQNLAQVARTFFPKRQLRISAQNRP